MDGNSVTWRDLSLDQRIALADVMRYGGYSRPYVMAGLSLMRAGLIERVPNAPIPTMGWRLTENGERVMKGRR